MFINQAVQSDEFSYAVLDKIPDMTQLIDADGSVLFMNSALKSKLRNGQGPKCSRIPGALIPCSECIAKKCILNHKKYSMLSRVKGRVYSVSAAPVSFGGQVYALETYHDITQEQNLKDRLIANNSRITKDLEVARSLQLSILRQTLPEIKGYRFFAEFLPCEELGGDMYDCFLARDGRIIMYIADVSGHGVMPAMLTVFLRQEMFAQCKTPGISPARVLRNMQDSFVELSTEDSIYITIFVLALDPKTGDYVYANAGHSVPPMIAGADGVSELFLPGTPVCRWDCVSEREERTGTLKRGEKLLLYTDGLDGVHTRQSSNRTLKQMLGSGEFSGKSLLDEIKSRLTQTKADDVTMLLCERE